MHLHPSIAALILEIGRDYGMKAVRVPDEPVSALRRAFPRSATRSRSTSRGSGGWTAACGEQGLRVNDHVFGLAWSGQMTEDRLLRLLPHLPDGVSEIYFHPAVERSPRADRERCRITAIATSWRRCSALPSKPASRSSASAA